MKDEVLRINKKEFFSVLENWEKYTSVLFKKLAKDMPTSFEMDSYHQQHIFAPFAEEIKLSNLSELLWKSLEFGAAKVDAIHDEVFVNEQIDYFKEQYHSAESIAHNTSSLAETFDFYEPTEPMKAFVKLGKPAQLKLIEEGLLEIAVSNYEQAEQIIEQKRRDEINKQREWLEKNLIPLQLKKQVRAKDSEKCVFCGRDYNYHSFGYWKTNDEKPEPDTVLLACNGCISKKKKGNI